MIVVLVAMIVFGFCVVLHQLFKLQVVEGEALQARALQPVSYTHLDVYKRQTPSWRR